MADEEATKEEAKVEEPAAEAPAEEPKAEAPAPEAAAPKEEPKAEAPAPEKEAAKKPKAAEKPAPTKAKKSAAIEDIMTSIKKMNVMELAELVKSLEEEFGVSAAAPVAVAAAPAGGAPALLSCLFQRGESTYREL